jgi:hypothetical protein
MALSSVVKNFRDGTILIQDGTGTPLALTVSYEQGNFAISGLKKKQNETVTYLDRGELGSVRHTSRIFPTGSFSAHMTELSDATNQVLPDIIRRQGSYAAAVSTLGSSADVYTLKLTLTVEGTDFGDASDHTIVLNDCECSVDFAEGDPNSFTINFTVYGTVSMT